MWTPTTREQHSRKNQRYQSDLTDEEWCVIEPHLPKPRAKGRPRSWAMREIINGIFYVMRAGCTWRLLPSDFPPWGTIYRWFATFRDDGRFEAINHTLVMEDRERVGREASPTGAIIDSQSVKTTEAGGRAATTRARRSTGVSVMLSSTPTGAALSSNLTRPVFRIATVVVRCCVRLVERSRSSRRSSPTAATQAIESPRPP
jgi:transposase